jgi:hypothetical protein
VSGALLTDSDHWSKICKGRRADLGYLAVVVQDGVRLPSARHLHIHRARKAIQTASPADLQHAQRAGGAVARSLAGLEDLTTLIGLLGFKTTLTAALYCSLAVLEKLRIAFRANRAGTRRLTAGCVPKPARSAGRAAVRREDSPSGLGPRRYRFGSAIFVQTASLSPKDM